MQEALYEQGAELQKLTLTIFEFQKSKINAREIHYKGKMYDFKSAVIKNNKVELLVINDAKEELILDLIKEIFTDTHKQKSKLPNQLSKILTLAYICPHKDICLFPPVHQAFFSDYSARILTAESKVPNPPPDKA